ncbi:hypothetical protein QP794_01640 [Paenibacillus sp. UMB7766-LJ446]|uniref:hypothetical protein n=1 Tax=Paenibacillus sp. UMB7766-LJ446 TaxID=3046313 RepID=UPI0025508454|nr:hypothetical protein [Paenibacillus sp. UMB7766-LJ446]MDK8188784.1 hypothetical protein [Paenibacillus sp. UMB7766-LJ446]
MTIVRVLVDAVGEYNAGDIVKDAPDGLVEIAKKQVRNAATGELLAEIIEGDLASTDTPSEREQMLQGELDESKKREAELLAQIAELQSDIKSGDLDDELKELKFVAKEMKIHGYTKMGIEELKEAIAATGGDAGGE